MVDDVSEEPDTSIDELETITLQLQGQVDRLDQRNQALERRVQRLEQDRATLRQRISDLTAGPLPRRLLRALHGSSPRVTRGASSPPNVTASSRAVDIPDGVGHIPDLDLPRFEPRLPGVRVASILDPFSGAAFAPECALSPLTATGWRAQVEEVEPDLLLVESAFTGPGGSWAHRIAHIGEPHADLREVVAWCRQRSIPTIFWNKEDPANFRWFIASASLFDWVFTVDVDTVDRYRRTLGHGRVGVMPFAAQPALQHPGEGDRPGRVAFAGTYYAQKHPSRLRQIESIVDPAREFGLHIFDRMGAREDARFSWPERYRSHIVGSLTYPQVLEAYRRYRIFLNVNTVTSSPTMCARRIFELAASGTPVISGPSRAVEAMMPEEAVSVCRTPDETRSAIGALLADDARWQQQADAARRWVLQQHTYEHRLADLLETVGLAS